MTQWPGEPNGPTSPGGPPSDADPDDVTQVVPKQPTGPSWGGPPPPPSPPQRPEHSAAGGSPSWGQPQQPPPPPPPPPPGWPGAQTQYPQYSQPQHGGAPQYPGAGSPKKRRTPLIIAGAIVAVVLLVAVVAVAVTRIGGGSGDNLSPTETVQAYLDALSRGDAEAALAFGKTQPASTDFLNADILKQQIEASPITDIRILSNDEGLANIGMATVQVAANFGDKVSDAQLRLSKVEETWKLETATIKIDPPTSRGSEDDANKTLTVFGKPFGDNSIYVFPGFLDISSSNEYVEVTSEPFLLDKLYLGTGYLQPDFTLNDDGTKAINKAIADAYGRCETSSLTEPPNCPVALNAYDAVEGSVSWGRADLSAVKVGNFDPYSLQVSVTGDVPIPVGYQTRRGETKTGTVTSYMYAKADLTKTPPVVDFD